MDNKMIIGKVVKSQGIKGEVKIELVTDDESRLVGLKTIYLDNEEYVVDQIKSLVNGFFVKFKGIDDRNMSDTLRGKNVSIRKDDTPKLKKGSYYIVDLVGCEISLEGNIIGYLADILQYGSADIYVVKGRNGNKDFMFPALKAVLKNVDIANKVIELNKDKLEEIAVYED